MTDTFDDWLKEIVAEIGPFKDEHFIEMTRRVLEDPDLSRKDRRRIAKFKGTPEEIWDESRREVIRLAEQKRDSGALAKELKRLT